MNTTNPAERFYCHQCGNHTTARFLSSVGVKEYALQDAARIGDGIDVFYSMIRCRSCDQVQLIKHEKGDGLDIKSANLLYPVPLVDFEHRSVPEAIAREFWEAQRVERTSKTAYAVLIGRVLERLCKDKEAKGRSLNSQIKDLSDRGVIPAQLSEMAHALRFLRNSGAHVTDYTIEDDEVQAMKDFTVTMIEYVYIAPAKLAALKATIEKKKGTMNESGDAE